ncbi:cbb3-type cytochrome oxidase assembly protein CcoS [Parahaliea mediterranea]|uniref:Cbb3-type cytochrome oxidase assembly protein CcoS n=1 Tax=Parahaliea mediterranea TaxID=651086 RepID=A0A939IMZ7_9GAMM|nr:cbb3-type cytochrome oxidase assembly protein CcoS [Parahaliea mediterranea]MBN7798045.1 cbb3-type cytochrome oxidase assembly protein CcoS [Parahaliea mediterranea]
MASLYLLIPIALVFCAVAIRLLLWAIDNGQYDDLDKEAWRALMDEEPGDTKGDNREPDEPHR